MLLSYQNNDIILPAAHVQATNTVYNNWSHDRRAVMVY